VTGRPAWLVCLAGSCAWPARVPGRLVCLAGWLV